MINKVLLRIKMWFLESRFSDAGHLTILGRPAIKGHGKISVGDNFFANRFLRIEVLGSGKERRLYIGNNASFGEYVHIGVMKKITIGNNVLFGSRILVIDHNHGNYNGNLQSPPDIPPNLREITSAEVEIGDNVWLGDGVVVLPGVKIGFGSIIGANSVVSRDIPPLSMASGIPCEPVKRFDRESGTWIRIKQTDR